MEGRVFFTLTWPGNEASMRHAGRPCYHSCGEKNKDNSMGESTVLCRIDHKSDIRDFSSCGNNTPCLTRFFGIIMHILAIAMETLLAGQAFLLKKGLFNHNQLKVSEPERSNPQILSLPPPSPRIFVENEEKKGQPSSPNGTLGHVTLPR